MMVSAPINDTSQVAQARRTAASLTGRLQFSEIDAARVALVVTEAATNIVKHAGRGEVLLRPLEDQSPRGLEMLALDKGPGMRVADCLRDGYSSTGSPGTGLGAMLRASSHFEIYSEPGKGAAILSRIYPGRRLQAPDGAVRTKLELGVVSVPKPGETVCGDAWAIVQDENSGALLLADGLGHGFEASLAATEAVRVFRGDPRLAPGEQLGKLHLALRATRGAAAAIARIDFGSRLLRFAGVGNIGATIVGAEGERSLPSHNGTVGHDVYKIQEFTFSWPAGARLIMHSDGVSQRWALDNYAGLASRHPSLIAGVLYRDFRRERDDATIMVAQDS